jgi:hypothetical protein
MFSGEAGLPFTIAWTSVLGRAQYFLGRAQYFQGVLSTF